MSDQPLTRDELSALAAFDTPTICNALEVVAPERRTIGFTTETMVCPFPERKPMVGYARTGMIRCDGKAGASRTRPTMRQGRSRLLPLYRRWRSAEDRGAAGPGQQEGLRLLLGRGQHRHPSRPRLRRPGDRWRRARSGRGGAWLRHSLRQGHALPCLGASRFRSAARSIFSAWWSVPMI